MTEKEKRDQRLFAALLVIIAVAPTQWGVKIAGIPLTPVDLVIGVAFAYWLLLAARRRAAAGMPPACLWAMVGTALISALNAHLGRTAPSTFSVSNDTRASLVNVTQLVEYLLVVYLLVWAALREQRQVRGAGFVLVAAAAVVVLVGVAHYLVRRAPEEAFHVQGTFSSRHVYGGFLAMALPVVFAIGLSLPERWPRLALLGLVVVGAATILSPGPLIGLVVALLLVAARTSGRALQGTLAGVLLFGAVMAVALPRNYEENIVWLAHPTYVDDTDEGKEKVKAQWMEWRAGAHMLQELPLLGVGPGNFQLTLGGAYSALGLEKPRKAMFGPDARVGRHMEPDMNSLYVVTAASTGLLGLAALAWALIHFGAAAAAAARRAADPAIRALAIGVWGGIIGFAVTSALNSLLVRGTGVELALFFGIAAVLRHHDWVADAGPNGQRRLHVI
ncbi:MAG: hypothetical protein HY321_04360 [Armatimonadetes bacterium]|nr:hypothetical protein [Armatimonadota bacterium]